MIYVIDVHIFLPLLHFLYSSLLLFTFTTCSFSFSSYSISSYLCYLKCCPFPATIVDQGLSLKCRVVNFASDFPYYALGSLIFQINKNSRLLACRASATTATFSCDFSVICDQFKKKISILANSRRLCVTLIPIFFHEVALRSLENAAPTSVP